VLLHLGMRRAAGQACRHVQMPMSPSLAAQAWLYRPLEAKRRPVAVKTFRPCALAAPGALRAIARDMKTLCSLQHP
jgi:hypothetical protein